LSAQIKSAVNSQDELIFMSTVSAPDISVNLAVFNAEPFLAASINSILSQSFQNFELIIVDDGSTDGSLDILKKYALQDTRIKLFRQANSGVGAARNLALKNSRGRYIAVMDADDISLPGRFTLQKDFLDTHAEIDAVGSQWLMIKPNGDEAGIDTHSTEPAMIQALMYGYYALHHPTTMIRRSSMEAVGGYSEEAGRLCVDYDLFMRMQMQGGKFSNLPVALFKWRLNPDGITHGKARRQTEFVVKTRTEGFTRLSHTDPDQALQSARNLLMSFPEGTWFDEKLRQTLPGEDRSYLLQALQSSPQPEAYFSALEYRILEWFEGRLPAVDALAAELRNSGLPWFAHQLEARYGLASADDSPPADFKPAKARSNQLSVLLPYSTADSDLLERIANIHECIPGAEIVVFPTEPGAVDDNIPAPRGVILISTKAILRTSPWEAALKAASGRYIAYLEPNCRLDAVSALNALKKLQVGFPLVYVPSDRYYLEALDEHGLPYKDPAPHPKWTQETLLGQNRIILSGFCHQRSLLEKLQLPASECGSAFSTALAMGLAHRNELVLADGRYRQYIPCLSLKNRVTHRFKQHMLIWYFDSALGTLPDKAVWEKLNASGAEVIARKLDAIARAGSFYPHWKNRMDFRDFFVNKVPSPIRFALFRQLIERYGPEINDALTRAGRSGEPLLCSAYSVIIRLTHQFRLK
jgi:glycosyltransferase involved in cell wall biosynthesis